jgi:hypothetical protein
MAKTFVRYSTGVERVDPNLGENLQVVLAYMKRGVAASEGRGREPSYTGSTRDGLRSCAWRG